MIRDYLPAPAELNEDSAFESADRDGGGERASGQMIKTTEVVDAVYELILDGKIGFVSALCSKICFFFLHPIARRT